MLVVVDVDVTGAVVVVVAVDNEGDDDVVVAEDDVCATGLVDFVVVLECVALGDEDEDVDVVVVVVIGR